MNDVVSNTFWVKERTLVDINWTWNDITNLTNSKSEEVWELIDFKLINQNSKDFKSYEISCLIKLEDSWIEWAVVVNIYEKVKPDSTIIKFSYIENWEKWLNYSRVKYKFFEIYPENKKVKK